MPSISKRVYGLLRTRFTSPSEDDPDAGVDVDQDEEEGGGFLDQKPACSGNSPPASSPTGENSFIHQYLMGRLTNASQPEIYFAKTGVDLPLLNVESSVGLPIRAAYTGPDGGLTQVPPLCKRPTANIANLDDELNISVLESGSSKSVDNGRLCSWTTESIIDTLLAQVPESLANSFVENPYTNGVEAESEQTNGTIIADWTRGDDRAFGYSTSLYETHPISDIKAGEPLADVFGVLARDNCCFLALADGVNWGERSRLAARCAVRGALEELNLRISSPDQKAVENTQELFHVLLGAFHSGHQLIVQEGGQLTTLCVCVVVKLKAENPAPQWVACACNVGDSLCFVYNRKHGVRELTYGSHDIREMRDMRDAGGALGPVDGVNPELHNLTCSMSFLDEGDLVFITSDGVSDNFDPVVGKFCVTKHCELYRKAIQIKEEKENAAVSPTNLAGKSRKKPSNGNLNAEESPKKKGGAGQVLPLHLPVIEAYQRHELMLLRMEDLLRNGISQGDNGSQNAGQLCLDLVNFSAQLTQAKRRTLEDPELYEGDKNLNRSEKQTRRKLIRQRISEMPGKLDHATVVAYEVGKWPPSGGSCEEFEDPLETSQAKEASLEESQVEENTARADVDVALDLQPVQLESPKNTSKSSVSTQTPPSGAERLLLAAVGNCIGGGAADERVPMIDEVDGLDSDKPPPLVEEEPFSNGGNNGGGDVEVEAELNTLEECCVKAEEEVDVDVSVADDASVGLDCNVARRTEDVQQECGHPMNNSYYEARRGEEIRPLAAGKFEQKSTITDSRDLAAKNWPLTEREEGNLKISDWKKKKKKHSRSSAARHTLGMDVGWFRKLMQGAEEGIAGVGSAAPSPRKKSLKQAAVGLKGRLLSSARRDSDVTNGCRNVDLKHSAV